MPGKQGYAPVGERGVGQQNWHARGRSNVVGALLLSCLLTVSLVSGTINANTFQAWIAQLRHIVICHFGGFTHNFFNSFGYVVGNNKDENSFGDK